MKYKHIQWKFRGRKGYFRLGRPEEISGRRCHLSWPLKKSKICTCVDEVNDIDRGNHMHNLVKNKIL